MSWGDKIQVKKGDIGEDLVIKYLKVNGYEILEHNREVGPHPYDIMARGKKGDFIVEVKSKPRRDNYPDTGVDLKHYNDYKTVSRDKKITVFLFFVDENSGKVYGGDLSSLDVKKTHNYNNRNYEYPKVENGIIYFFQPSMSVFFELTKEDTDSLKGFCSRNSKYSK